MRYPAIMPEDTLVEVVETTPSDLGEDYSQVVLPVRPHRFYVVFRQSDNSFVLRPTEAVSDEQAQRDYDNDPELQRLLKEAAEGPRVRRRYVHRQQ